MTHVLSSGNFVLFFKYWKAEIIQQRNKCLIEQDFLTAMGVFVNFA